MFELGKLLLNNSKKLGNPQKQYFGYQNTFDHDPDNILVNKLFNIGLNVNGLHWKSKSNRALYHIPKKELKNIYQPNEVKFIESIYRNSM